MEERMRNLMKELDDDDRDDGEDGDAGVGGNHSNANSAKATSRTTGKRPGQGQGPGPGPGQGQASHALADAASDFKEGGYPLDGGDLQGDRNNPAADTPGGGSTTGPANKRGGMIKRGISGMIFAGGGTGVGAKKSRESEYAEPKFMEDFFAEVEEVKKSIQDVEQATEDVKKIQDKAVTAVGSEPEYALSQELNAVLSDANKQCSFAKKKLEEIKEATENLDEKKFQSEIRVRKNMHATVSQNLVQVVRDYQAVQQQYKTSIKEKVARQIKVVKPEATYDEIDMAMRSGDTGAVYRAAILQPGSDPIAEAYLNVADKYQDVLKLEKSVEELHRMFMDLALLVETQGEMLDQIEIQVYNTKDYVSAGNKELNKALAARKAMRRKLCCIAVLILVLMAIILGPVLSAFT